MSVVQRPRVASDDSNRGRCIHDKYLSINSLQAKYYPNAIMSLLDASLVHVSQILLSAQQHFRHKRLSRLVLNLLPPPLIGRQ